MAVRVNYAKMSLDVKGKCKMRIYSLCGPSVTKCLYVVESGPVGLYAWFTAAGSCKPIVTSCGAIMVWPGGWLGRERTGDYE